MSEWDVGEGRGGLFIENRTHDHENKTLSIRIMLYARFYGLFKVMTCPQTSRVILGSAVSLAFSTFGAWAGLIYTPFPPFDDKRAAVTANSNSGKQEPASTLISKAASAGVWKV